MEREGEIEQHTPHQKRKSWHPLWAVVLVPLIFGYIATLVPTTTRALLLVCGVVASTVIFHAYAAKQYAKTIPMGLVFIVSAAVLLISDEPLRALVFYKIPPPTIIVPAGPLPSDPAGQLSLERLFAYSYNAEISRQNPKASDIEIIQIVNAELARRGITGYFIPAPPPSSESAVVLNQGTMLGNTFSNDTNNTVVGQSSPGRRAIMLYVAPGHTLRNSRFVGNTTGVSRATPR